MDVKSSKKYVIYDQLLSFMVLVSCLSEEEISEVMNSLREAHGDDELIAMEFIAACEKYAKSA